MEPRHGPRTTRSVVEYMPQCLNYLAVKHPRAWNKGRCITCIALLDMAMNVKKTYTALNVEVIVELYEVLDCTGSCEEVHPVLAHDIV